MDAYDRIIIVKWLQKHLENCENPRLYGKSLKGDRSNQWRYRVGKYRIIADIQDDQVLILILEVGHRRDIYD